MIPRFLETPLEAIARGRSLEEVPTAYMTAYENCHKAAATPGKSKAEAFADATTGVVALPFGRGGWYAAGVTGYYEYWRGFCLKLFERNR